MYDGIDLTEVFYTERLDRWNVLLLFISDLNFCPASLAPLDRGGRCLKFPSDMDSNPLAKFYLRLSFNSYVFACSTYLAINVNEKPRSGLFMVYSLPFAYAGGLYIHMNKMST